MASVVGLVSLALPRITAADFGSVEREMVVQLGEAARAAQEYEQRIAKNKEQIDKLESERQQIEIIVRQASLQLFSEQRLSRVALDLEKEISGNAGLLELLDQYQRHKRVLEQLKGEISESPHAQRIIEIIDEFRLLDKREEDHYLFSHPVLRKFEKQFVKIVVDALAMRGFPRH